MTPELLAWQPAHQQRVFRCLMNAFAYPGRVQALPGVPGQALRSVLATLVDGACCLADAHQLLSEDDRRRLGAQPCVLEQADFIVARGTQPLAHTPRLGTLEDPEQGATIVLTVAALGTGAVLTLQGPGIADAQTLRVSGVDPTWWTQRGAWNAHFPMGVDVILVSAEAVAALPRTTRISVEGGL
jgi:alpha-D-ribose 1-methylphosphonate 5-triphosphate synthase subunit PhnH